MKSAAVLLLWNGSILAQVVGEVRVIGAPSSIELESRAGESLDSGRVQHDVKNLWQSGRAADVTVETQTDGDGVQLLFRVRARRTLELRKLQVEPTTPGIHAGVAAGDEIDSQQAQQVAASVRKQLESSGFPNAAVSSRLLPAGDGKVDLRIHVDKGRPVDIEAVTFSGNFGIPESQLARALRATKRKTILPGWHLRSGYSEDAVASDEANLRSFYFQRGYFEAEVRAGSVRIEKNRAWAGYAIDSGPRFEFSTRAACGELFRERLDAEHDGVLDFRARLEVRGAEVSATADRGTAYRVNRIQFRGNHSFRDSTLRRSFLLAEGDLLDETLVRRSLARLNRTGLFELLTPASVVVNTPPGTDRADVTVGLKEKKARDWVLSGPVGPMSIAGPLQFAIGARLPAWGQGVLELSTYTLSANLMLFAKPIGDLIPLLPHKRFLPLATVQRPLLPGQPWLSGFTIAPQLGWRGILLGYGVSRLRNWTGGLTQAGRAFSSSLPVTIVADGKEKGTMNCEPPKSKAEWARQIGGTAANLAFSLAPF